MEVKTDLTDTFNKLKVNMYLSKQFTKKFMFFLLKHKTFFVNKKSFSIALYKNISISTTSITKKKILNKGSFFKTIVMFIEIYFY